MTTPGLALPAIAFIVWPTKKPNNASLPALYCKTLSALAARISSIRASISPVSLVCFNPRSSTILPAQIDSILAANADKVQQYRDGKEALFGFFVGQTMKAMAGKANPQVINERLKAKLAK